MEFLDAFLLPRGIPTIKIEAHIKRGNTEVKENAVADHYAKISALPKVVSLPKPSKDISLEGVKEAIKNINIEHPILKRKDLVVSFTQIILGMLKMAEWLNQINSNGY